MFRYLVLLFFLVLSPNLSCAEPLTIDLASGDLTSRMVQIIGLLTILSLAPGILIMVTSFTRVIVILSFLRNALGLQQTPPNMVLTSLALFITFFIMSPTLEGAYKNAVLPLIDKKVSEEEAWEVGSGYFHEFMMKNTREKELALFMDLSDTDKLEKVSLHVLIPAFMLSELKRAFEIGFLIFIPFLIIDMVVASTLMAMGMMMVPPVMIALPFKLIFFVLIDGWYMLCSSIIQTYN